MRLAILICILILSLPAVVTSQYIPNSQFDWFYFRLDDCETLAPFYLSAHQDPRLESYSKESFIQKINILYNDYSWESEEQDRVLKLKIAFPLESKPFLLRAGVKDGREKNRELKLLNDFVATWKIDPAIHDNVSVASICRIYIYWSDGRIKDVLFRKALFQDDIPINFFSGQ